MNQEEWRGWGEYTTLSCESTPHIEAWECESPLNESDAAWARWFYDTERLLGCVLDGDQDEDGYSIDHAYDCYGIGMTPEAYVAQVKERQELIKTCWYMA